MVRTKTIKKGSDGKRKETRAEKHTRVEEQRRAREACLKILPYVGGAVLVCVILFGLWVRSVPPRQPKPKITQVMPPGAGQGVPDFMNIQVDPNNLPEGEDAQQAAIEEAMRLLQEKEGAQGDQLDNEPVASSGGAEDDEGEVQEL